MIQIQAEFVEEISRREYDKIMATAMEKRLELAPKFRLTEREKEIDDLLASIKLAMSVSDEARNKHTAAADAVKLSERMIIAEAPGSNAEKRRAAAEESMVKDAGHLSLITVVQETQAKWEEADRDLTMLGRTLAAKQLGFQAQIGMLHFLAVSE